MKLLRWIGIYGNCFQINLLLLGAVYNIRPLFYHMKKIYLYIAVLFLFSPSGFTQDTKLILPAAQGINIRSAGFSPDAKFFVTTQDKTIKFWEVLTGKVAKNIEHKTDYAIYSHNGKYILTDNGQVWDVENGTIIFSTDEDGCDFSKDDNFLLTTKGNKINIHEIKTGLVNQFELPGAGPKIWAFFTPDGKNILAWTNSKVEVWNISQKKRVASFKENHYVRWASFSPDGLHIITSTVDSVLKIRDAATGSLLKELKGHSGIVATVSYSPDGLSIVSASYDKTIKIWDAKSGKIRFTIPAHSDRVNSAFYSSDGKWIITSSWDKSVKIWESATGKLYGHYMGSINLITTAIYNGSGDQMAILTDSSIKLCNTANMEITKSLNEGKGYRQQVEFSADGKFLITKGAVSYSPHLWNLSSGKITNVIPFNDWISSLKYSADGKYIAASVISTKPVQIWNVQNSTKAMELKTAKSANTVAFDKNSNVLYLAGEEIFLADIQNRNYFKKYTSIKDSTIHTLQYSTDFQFIFIASKNSAAVIDAARDSVLIVFDNPLANYETATFSQDRLLVKAGDSLEIRNTTDGTLLHRIAFNNSMLYKTSLTPDKKFIMSAGVDNSLKFWDVNTGKLAWSYFVLFNTDFFTLLNSQSGVGYYYGTKNAVKELSFEVNGIRYPFEQLDVKYNRPDKVLEAIGSTDTALIKSYRRAWEKRIKKLGIDTTAFSESYSVLEADFANRETIQYEQKGNRLKLHIKGFDSTYKLDRFNVWLNEVPVFGQRGISIRKNNKHSIDTIITVKLSEGKNQLETSITDVNGTESYRLPLRVNYKPAVKPKDKIYFIGIGIDQFADNQYNLQYSAKDIRDLSKKLKEKYGNNIIIDTLFNENVTVRKVKAFKKKLQQTTENDKVIVAYSGHGLLSKEYDYYLSTYSVNFENPEQNGLPYDELENLLDSIPARKKLMLIDACHSGEVDKDDLVTLNASSDSLIKGLKPVAYKKEGNLGLKNSFELMQSLFVNVGKSTGTTIISAAAGTQFALERNDLKNGVFTYSILEAMNKYPTMRISELKKTVGERVEQLTKGLQKPTSRSETIAVDWNLW